MTRLSNLMLCVLVALPAMALDLREAVVVLAPDASVQERKAAQTLVEEVEKRSQVRFRTAGSLPGDAPAIILGTNDQVAALAPSLARRLIPAPTGAEGFRVQVIENNVVVAGNDDRGVLFGAGYLLRHLKMQRGRIVTIEDSMKAGMVPKIPLRGHQLGYRPKTNSYDAFTVEMWEQYIRDLAVFGTNAIELIPPRSDDADDSPHFPLPKIDMMVEMSRILDEYGLDVWIWYPAMDRDYSDPKTVEFAIQEWAEVFSAGCRASMLLWFPEETRGIPSRSI